MKCRKCDCEVVPSNRYLVAKGKVIECRVVLADALEKLLLAEKQMIEALEADEWLT